MTVWSCQRSGLLAAHLRPSLRHVGQCRARFDPRALAGAETLVSRLPASNPLFPIQLDLGHATEPTPFLSLALPEPALDDLSRARAVSEMDQPLRIIVTLLCFPLAIYLVLFPPRIATAIWRALFETPVNVELIQQAFRKRTLRPDPFGDESLSEWLPTPYEQLLTRTVRPAG